MLKTTAVSAIALLATASAAGAQTVLWGDPAPQQQIYPAPQYQPSQPAIPYVPPPQLPLNSDANAPLYYDTVPTAPSYPPPQRLEPRAADPLPATPAPRYRVAEPPAPPPVTTPPAPANLNPPAYVSARPDLVREFAGELSGLVELAERYRAASPGFIEDLRELAEKYQTIEIVALPRESPSEPEAIPAPDVIEEAPAATPDLADTEPEAPMVALQGPEQTPEDETVTATPPEPAIADAPTVLPQDLPPTTAAVVYLRDDFADGDFLANPAWTVREGDWSVDETYGLRPLRTRPETTTPITPKDLLQYLLGDEQPASDAPRADSRASLIEAETQIGNAFSLVTTVTDHSGEGAAHFILHQGGANWLGYRLELRAGPRPLMVLARRGASGYKDIMKVEAPGFTTGEPHQLRWARLSDGQMFVLIDGEPIITARDTVFQQGWSGFAYFVAGGDVSMRNVRIAEPVEQ